MAKSTQTTVLLDSTEHCLCCSGTDEGDGGIVAAKIHMLEATPGQVALAVVILLALEVVEVRIAWTLAIQYTKCRKPTRTMWYGQPALLQCIVVYNVLL
jgi:hypothetical protein